MPDTKSTQEVSTTSSHVTTLTAVAQVVGTLVTAYGGVLAAWEARHTGSLWPPVVLALAGLLLVAASHFGYVKGQASTQNAIVAALTAAATSPLAIDLIMGLVTKRTQPGAEPPPAFPIVVGSIPPVTSPSAAVQQPPVPK